MSHFAYFVFSTGGALLVVAAAVLWFAGRPRSASARACAVGVAVAYVLASTYAVPAGAARLLARPYHRFAQTDVPSGRVAVVVFGAGDDEVPGWDGRVAIPNTVAATRVLEAWRVFRLASAEWLISSGGNSDASDTEPSGINMRTLLVQLGAPASRIIVEAESRETHENAVNSAAILRSLHADHAILVTSAVHMRRSMGAMAAAGVSAIPAIAPDAWFDNDWIDWLTPSNHGLYFSGEVVHEILGLPYYRVRGWLR